MGAEVNLQNNYGWSALALASHYNHLSTVKLLLSHSSIKINACTVFGFTPLMLSIYQGNLSILQSLVESGAELDSSLPVGVSANMGISSLMIAASQCNWSIVNYLLQKSAEFNKQCKLNGFTALMYVASSKSPSSQVKIGTILSNVAIFKKLLEYGADPSVKNWVGNTALDIAWRQKNNDLAQTILSLVGENQLDEEDNYSKAARDQKASCKKLTSVLNIPNSISKSFPIYIENQPSKLHTKLESLQLQGPTGLTKLEEKKKSPNPVQLDKFISSEVTSPSKSMETDSKVNQLHSYLSHFHFYIPLILVYFLIDILFVQFLPN